MCKKNLTNKPAVEPVKDKKPVVTSLIRGKIDGKDVEITPERVIPHIFAPWG